MNNWIGAEELRLDGGVKRDKGGLGIGVVGDKNVLIENDGDGIAHDKTGI